MSTFHGAFGDNQRRATDTETQALPPTVRVGVVRIGASGPTLATDAGAPTPIVVASTSPARTSRTGAVTPEA